MKRYSVSTRGGPVIHIDANNWMTALGLALEQLGCAEVVERLACEVLPNTTVIARDIQSGTRYVVQAIEEEDIEEAHTLDSVAIQSIDNFEVRINEIQEASSRTFACQMALEAAQDVLDIESGSVLLLRDGYLRFMTAIGPVAPRLVGVRMPKGTGIAGMCMDKRQIVVLRDAAADPRHFSEMDRLTGYRTRQLACVPVISAGRVLGVIEVMNLPPGEQFSRTSLRKINRVANALGARLAKD